jgi:hypothetical protein
MNSHVRELLKEMSSVKEEDRNSFFGKTLNNKLLLLDYPVEKGKWQLWLETCNDVLAAYSVGFVSEDNPYLDVGIVRSGSQSIFLGGSSSG